MLGCGDLENLQNLENVMANYGESSVVPRKTPLFFDGSLV
jgi:hypothetical protein